MSTIYLAQPDDLDRLESLVVACQEEIGLEQSQALRRQGVEPLLAGIPHGAAYLFGPRRAPLGYVIITFSWSVRHAGMIGFVEDLYVRPAVRGRGIAREILKALPNALAQGGIKALHVEIRRGDTPARQLFARAGLRAREDHLLMTATL